MVTVADVSVRKRSLRMVLLLAVVYLVVGVAFAEFPGVMWRRLAWLVSAVFFLAHIGYEQVRLGNSLRTTATHAAMAAAGGAFGLAVAANIHGWWVASSHKGLLAVALVAWPLITAIPAFVVALAAAAVLSRWRRRSSPQT